MPRRPRSGTKGLVKQHRDGCTNRSGDLTNCSCPWWGKYRNAYVSLARWSNQNVDPRSKTLAKKVLGRLVAAADAGSFSPEGEQQSLGSGQRLSEFIKEWQTHYAEKYDLTSNSLDPMLG